MENKPEPDKTREASLDREIANSYKNIPGWGHDADPDNDPTYPMKHWNGADHQRFNYDKPAQQPVNIEVLHSIERPGVSRVFGTSTPPAGLSGKLRRYAFKYSESTYAHWFPLVLADRINVIEGYIDDFKNGIVPNPFVERGWTGEWKYNKKGVLKGLAIGVAIAAVTVAVINKKNKSKAHKGLVM